MNPAQTEQELQELSKRIRELQEMKALVLEDRRAYHKHMTKEEKMEAARLLSPLDSFMQSILNEGFMTGSMVYGDPAAAKDRDMCVLIHPRAFTGQALGAEDTDYFEEDGFQALYANDGSDLPVNIICFSNPRLYEAWQKATITMKTLSIQSPGIFFTKWKRVRVFRAFVDIFWKVETLPEFRRMDTRKALDLKRCVDCGREAIYFTTMSEQLAYETTGICERCRNK